MGKQWTAGVFSTPDKVDGHQRTLNKEIKGEDTSNDPEVPAICRQFLEHRAAPNEHPPT